MGRSSVLPARSGVPMPKWTTTSGTRSETLGGYFGLASPCWCRPVYEFAAQRPNYAANNPAPAVDRDGQQAYGTLSFAGCERLPVSVACRPVAAHRDRQLLGSQEMRITFWPGWRCGGYLLYCLAMATRAFTSPAGSGRWRSTRPHSVARVIELSVARTVLSISSMTTRSARPSPVRSPGALAS